MTEEKHICKEWLCYSTELGCSLSCVQMAATHVQECQRCTEHLKESCGDPHCSAVEKFLTFDDLLIEFLKEHKLTLNGQALESLMGPVSVFLKYEVRECNRDDWEIRQILELSKMLLNFRHSRKFDKVKIYPEDMINMIRSCQQKMK